MAVGVFGVYLFVCIVLFGVYEFLLPYIRKS